MKLKVLKVFVIAIILICCCGCSNEATEKQAIKLTRKQKIAETESQIAAATHGFPLSVPILAESGPRVHLIPVTHNYKTIEKIYILILDARDTRHFDIYLLDSVVCNGWKYYYAVTDVTEKENTHKRLNIIEDHELDDIIAINNNYGLQYNETGIIYQVRIPFVGNDSPIVKALTDIITKAETNGANWTVNQWKSAYRQVAIAIKPMMIDMSTLITEDNLFLKKAEKIQEESEQVEKLMNKLSEIAKNTENGKVVEDDTEFAKQLTDNLAFRIHKKE